MRSRLRESDGEDSTHPERSIPVRLERRQLLLVDLDFNVLIFPDAFDLVEDLGVAEKRKKSVGSRTIATTPSSPREAGGKKRKNGQERPTYSLASKMSSNFFFNAAGSLSGQLLSS